LQLICGQPRDAGAPRWQFPDHALWSGYEILVIFFSCRREFDLDYCAPVCFVSFDHCMFSFSLSWLIPFSVFLGMYMRLSANKIQILSLAIKQHYFVIGSAPSHDHSMPH
jgi:hypothetical protein